MKTLSMTNEILPEIIEDEKLRDIVFEVVKDIFTSPQNDITKFPDYDCTSFAILWNLMNSEKYKVSKLQLIQISLRVDELRKSASRLLELQMKKGDVKNTPPLNEPTNKQTTANVIVTTEFGKLPRQKRKIVTNDDNDLINDFENQKHVFISRKLNPKKKKNK